MRLLRLTVLVAVAAAALTIPSAASSFDEPDEICVRVGGTITLDLVTGQGDGTLRVGATDHLVTATSEPISATEFAQTYTFDVGPFLDVIERQGATFPRGDGGVVFLSTATPIAGASSGRLSYIGVAVEGVATYDVFGRICGFGPDLVLFNGTVHTVSDGTQQAVAVQDDRIIAVGSDADILDVFIAGSTPATIDLGGATVVPGFVDAHSHVFDGALAPGALPAIEDARFAQGVTTQGEPTAVPAVVRAMSAADASGSLRLRSRMWVAYNDVCGAVLPGSPAPHLVEPIVDDPRAAFGVLGTKIFADGGNCNAPAISFEYQPGLDPPPASPSGDLYLTEDELTDVVDTADAAGHQVIVHAIGDVGVETAVAALSNVIGSENDRRHRIEHNVLVRPDVIAEYVAHDIGAVVFGGYYTCLHNAGGWWGQHLEPSQFDWLYPWRDLVDAGVSVGWQADSPTFTADTMRQWFGLVTIGEIGTDSATGAEVLCEAPPWLASHGLDVAEALEVMTLGSARQMHLDNEVGSIEPGKAADLVILSSDPLDPDSGGATTLLDTEVLWTMTRGEVVHCDPFSPVSC